MNYELLERKTEKHEIQMLSCDKGLNEDWMSAETMTSVDVARIAETPIRHNGAVVFMTLNKLNRPQDPLS